MTERVKNVLCPDSKRRTAILAGQPDTFFSQPARVKVKGKTVTGFITSFGDANGRRDYKFIPNLYNKNCDVFTDDQLVWIIYKS